MLSLSDGLMLPAGLLATGLLLGLVWGRLTRRPAHEREGFLTAHPAARRWLRAVGLTEPGQVLALEAPVVSGHPGRHVARLTLPGSPEGDEPDGGTVVYLKREEGVSWRIRLAGWLAGAGFVSRSVREAQILQSLEHEGLPAPRYLAAGEDDRGRAFLLVRGLPGAVSLVGYLRAETDPVRRRRVARRLGEALARLHEAGLEHRDLYAKHVLVGPETGEVFFLDWQRARRYTRLSDSTRARDLAALHATLAPEFASACDRVSFLTTYLRAAGGGVKPGRTQRRAFMATVERHARRLLTRRHVREKRQPPPAEDQSWICLDGERLCVTPALRHLRPAVVRERLGLEQVLPGGGPVARRWLVLPDVGRALLVRRRTQHPLTTLLGGLLGRRVVSPEQRQATLLLRLARHGVAAPRVLAMGQRCSPGGRVESFLLTEPATPTVGLTTWLRRRPEPDLVGGVLRQAGALLRRLHEASCYLDGVGDDIPLAVAPDDGPTVVLDRADGVRTSRGYRPGQARRDLARLEALLLRAGCGPTDLRRFATGYHAGGEGSARPGSASPPSSREPVFLTPPSRGSSDVNPDSMWGRLTRGARRLRARPDWAQLVGDDWPDRIMDEVVTDRFHTKQGRSTGRWILKGPDGSELVVYLKRHHELPRWQGLQAAIWPGEAWSPAFEEWDHLEWARRQGVPVPPVVAAGEFLAPGGRLSSFLAVEELTGMLALNEALPLAEARLAPPEFRRWKAGVIAEMARLTRLLHDRRCFHKDLYLCHFFVHEDDLAGPPEGGWRGRVFVIDLHRLARHPWTWPVWQLKDLAALLYSSEVPGVDARDQVLFWRLYRGVGPRRRADRWLRWLVRFKWRRYRRHNLRRKARLRAEGVQEVTAGVPK